MLPAVWPGLLRIFEADVPRGPARGRAQRAQIVPKINQDIFDPVICRDLGDNIDGVLFAKAAKIQRHSRFRQKYPSGLTLHLGPSNQLSRRGNRAVRRNRWLLGFPIPEFDQRQCSRIQYALGHQVEAVAQIEEIFHVLIDVDPSLAGGGVDPADQAGGTETRIFRLECIHPIDRGVLECYGLRLSVRREILNLAGRAEGGKRQFAQLPRRVPCRGSRRGGGFGLGDESHGGFFLKNYQENFKPAVKMLARG